jgi:hypothetical protein
VKNYPHVRLELLMKKYFLFMLFIAVIGLGP